MFIDYRQQIPGMQQMPMGMQGMPFTGMPTGQPMEMQQPTGFQPQLTEQQGAQPYFTGFPGGSGFERRLERIERQVERLDRQVNRLNRRVSRIERQLGWGRPEDVEVHDYSGGYY